MTDQNHLSGREIEILKLVATGLTNREIAQNLFISPNTVKVHLSNIFEKISVSSRTEATLYGIEHGLVDVPGGGEAQRGPEQPGLVEEFHKYVWIGIPLFLLLAVFLVTLTFNVLVPPPTPEGQTLTELAERWRELAPLPAARKGMAAAAYNSEVYVIAGEGPEGVSGDVFCYAPDTDTWEQLSDKPTPVTDVHAVLIGEKIYLPGGRGADGRPMNILEIYDPRRDAWLAGAPLPEAISAYALADFEGQMYLFGGWDGEHALDAVYVYDPGADAWRLGTPMAIPRRDHGAVALVDKIIVLGGRNETGALKDAVSYFPSRDAGGEDPWEDFVDLPEERYGFGAESSGEAVYIFGGVSDSDPNSIVPQAYQFADSSWRALQIDDPGRVSQPVVLSLGLQVYVLSPGTPDNPTTLWRYQAVFYEIFLPIIQ
jgi:DNA-binding CsgD family transcriptional regulator